jgi:murein DD-endopeptidase MepM/ murein hydrolase activator NlpD
MNSYPAPHYTPNIDGLTLAAFLFMALVGLVVINDLRAPGPSNVPAKEIPVEQQEAEAAIAEPTSKDGKPGSGGESVPKPASARAFAAPYEHYTLTQGLHGYSYGHAAIDLAAGKGAAILSPINGEVTELYIDQYGNPTLVIENKIYRVTLLHGNYTVNVGDQVNLGQRVGKESNQGYTTDMAGQPCAGRECGYHTHLNVFDKRIGTNVNPLDLIDK